MHSRPVCFFVNKAFSLLTFLMIYSCLHVGYDDVVVWYSWYVSMSVIMSWSDIPGTFVDDLTSVVFETKTWSSRFPSLVGWLWTWVRLWKLIKSVNSCCISLSGPVAVCCFQLMLGQLKPPANRIFYLFASECSKDSLSWSKCWWSRCDM